MTTLPLTVSQLSTVESARAQPVEEPLKIALVTPRYHPYTGGVENHVHQVASRLVALGHSATVLTTDPGGELVQQEVVEGVQIRRSRAWPANRDYYFAPSLYRAIRGGDWDVVHLQSYHTLVAPVAMLAAWRAGIPYVVTFHGGGHSSQLRNQARRLQRVLLRPLLARAARLVATAEFEIAFFGKQLSIEQDRFALIPNGGDLPEVTEAATGELDYLLIVSVGRLEKYKGHHRILQAMPNILAERPDVRLWIAGTGPYEAELHRLADEMGVADKVEIRAVPLADRSTMAKELSKAALMVLLSEYETHPMAVLEALALKVPALVADTSGLGELAEKGLARAVLLDSAPEEVAAAVIQQLDSPLIPDRFHLSTWDECTEELLRLYQQVMKTI